jgi:hypothetical protein
MRPSTRDLMARQYQDEPKVAVYSAQMTESESAPAWQWAALWVAAVLLAAGVSAIAG